MKNWYNSLAPRERTLVFYGGIATSLLLIWMLVAKPLYNNHKKLNKVIASQEKTLATMQSQSQQVKQLQQQETKPASSGSGNPQQLVERALQTWRLKPQLERMQSQGSNGVRLSLKNVNADRVMRFLHELENKYGLVINNLVITNEKKEAGFADIRLTIKRS
ncbi:MAG: type II secretion system protein GspM [Cocleimonas sp.]